MEPQTLGAAIKARREQTGETFDDLADLFGVKQPTVSRWANDKAKPGDDHLQPLADWLGLTYDEVVVLRHRPPAIDLNSAAADLSPDSRQAVLDFIAEERRKQQG